MAPFSNKRRTEEYTVFMFDHHHDALKETNWLNNKSSWFFDQNQISNYLFLDIPALKRNVATYWGQDVAGQNGLHPERSLGDACEQFKYDIISVQFVRNFFSDLNKGKDFMEFIGGIIFCKKKKFSEDSRSFLCCILVYCPGFLRIVFDRRNWQIHNCKYFPWIIIIFLLR